ncbi:hypothetical protein [Riemerella anatipestifer]|uniref:Uncharacterized protein n=1 Tax=Riemerella anatipestifer TaxID=34085 RepID=A0AAP6HFS8_RIEAN|nr:hypothetical protein [Riemerella anatipestifer]MCU7540395.1 hypothetical protein [Riemerella anatipestifer]MCU7598731.1 hypothetical protein [Riemerella anatipestifer]MCW0495553.1 hypothetical protein [Riemerella anatipestifer]MCW0503414.1 hypothetical protein [Riemerella anatipestifer]MCW0509913.1 hypothetical protein [Riemerella anatipestifer]
MWFLAVFLVTLAHNGRAFAITGIDATESSAMTETEQIPFSAD